MAQEKKRDITINGSGSASGGTYERVKIRGEGSVGGDLECALFKCQGTSRVNGAVKAEQVKIQGETSIHGALQAGDVHIYGRFHVDENVIHQRFKVSGDAHVQGCLKGEAVHLKGSVDIKGDCEAESFQCSGGFTIGGLLNADTTDIRLYWSSAAKEIGGESIVIKKGAFSLLKSIFMPFSHARLSVEMIEGDEIYLEQTRAKVVRGHKVHIGPGCDIEQVEYKDDFRQAQEAKVTHRKKI